MAKILITGGAGFIPSSMADRLLLTPEHQLVLADNLLTGSMQHVPRHDRCTFIKCDVNDYRAIAEVMVSHQFDYVFHYAAVVGVKRTLENPILVLNDLEGIKHLLSLGKSTGVKRVFFSSSSEVYGEPVEFPQNEQTTPLNSRLPYAVVKNAGEAFLKAYRQEYGINYTVFRFFNTYGPRQSTDFVISKFLRAALQHQPIPVYGDGSQSRTFCYIDDNTECVDLILTHNLMVNDVINIGSDIHYSIADLARLIVTLTGSKSAVEFLPPLKEGDMTRRMPDLTKMKSILKRPFTPLEEGIHRILKSGAFSKL
jgi:UDP-glucose 4-epimerase